MIDSIPVQTTPSAPFRYRAGLTASTTGDVIRVAFDEPVLVFLEGSLADRIGEITWELEGGRYQEGGVLQWQEGSSRAFIYSFPGEPYVIREPIPVNIERLGVNDCIARFEEANVAMSGETEQEAFQNLIAEILDAFEALSGEANNLGLEPARQLGVLNKYVLRQQ